MIGVEPIRPKRTPDFESDASANSATPPFYKLTAAKLVKAEIGFEPTIKVLQTSALPLGYPAISFNFN